MSGFAAKEACHHRALALYSRLLILVDGVMRRLFPFAFLLSIPIVLSACGGGGKPSTVSQQVPAAGATVSLGKDVTLQIPAGALADATKVTITKKNAPGDALAGGQSLGAGFNIDLGGQTLAKPVTLEIAYDPKKLPQDVTDAQAFAAYYDEQKGVWVPAAGTVDAQRHVISIQTDHLSWWNPFSWNWGAWIAVLNDALTLNVTDFLHAVSLLTNDCPQSGSTVSVDSSQANNVIQGCVEQDDPSSPQLRVVNPKAFFYEVKPLSGGNGYPPDTMLGPGDDLKFQASTSDPAPLVVQAEITQKAGLYLIVHLIIQMLPGLNELGIQGPQIACITEKLSDVSYFVSASEALLVNHDGAAAAEQLIDFLRDDGAVQRFITGASDCNYGAARTWSVEGIKQVGGATATIISATDFVANYFLNYDSRVSFRWTQPPTPTPSIESARACSAFPKRDAPLGSPQEALSKGAIDKLRPNLPHFIQGYVTSTGVAVDIDIGVPESSYSSGTSLEIDPRNLVPDYTPDSQLPTRVETFRDAAAAAFRWISSEGVCVGDLLVYWRSGDEVAVDQAEGFWDWLIPSDTWPEVICSDGSCRFQTVQAGASTPEEAVFRASGEALSNWRGECNPRDGSGLAIYDACYWREEQRSNTIRFTVLIDQPPARGGPGVDTFTVYVREGPNGWAAVGSLCMGDCPWPP